MGVEESVVTDVSGLLALDIVAVNFLNDRGHGHGEGIGLHLGHVEVNKGSMAPEIHSFEDAHFFSRQVILSH